MLQNFVADFERHSYSYAEVGQSETNHPIKGFDNDLNRIRLGQGAEVYRAACKALRNWQMFPGGWATIGPHIPEIRAGETVAMIVHLFGFYWLNPCRIIYTFDTQGETKKYGFAYGTLPGHIEKGEERFSVEMLPDGSVWYDLRAYSKPQLWFVKLGYPVARFFQKRFVRESQRAMQRAVWEDARMRAEKEAENENSKKEIGAII